MATTADIYTDAFGRIRETVHSVAEGLQPEQLSARPSAKANSIGWLLWHLTRVQDDHIADAAGLQQIYTSGGWAERLGLDLTSKDTGYGHSSDEVAAVSGVSAADLVAYHDAVHEQTAGFLRGLRDADLDRIVDENWDPPVTLAVRLVSVIEDDLQHVGQAAYVRGLLTD